MAKAQRKGYAIERRNAGTRDKWIPTGETFTGTKTEVDGLVDKRKTEDGFDYRAVPA